MTLLLVLLAAVPPTQPPTRVAALDGGAVIPVSATFSGIATVSGIVYVADAGPPINVNPHGVIGLVGVNIVDAGPPRNVQGTFWQSTQPVSLASVPAHGLTGQVSVNITDAGAPLNVQGTFFQATQPVSLASVPTHGVTGTFWQATQPVSLASAPTTPVTGTFWQTTQPVSGTFWQATQPVSGTFWQATQPVSGTVAATQSGTWGARVTGNAGANLDGPTGSAPPANAFLQGLRETTNMVAQVQCDKTAMANIATATDTQLVALSGSTIIYVCSAYIEIQGVATTAGTLQLEYGTGTNCGTGKTAISPTFIGSTTAGNPTVVPMSAGAGYLFKTTAGQALCALSTTTTVQKVFITYAQF